MRRATPFLFLLLLSFALADSASAPAPPMLIWGEINAPCALTTLSPDITVAAEYNGTVISSLPLAKDGNLFLFGGPRAADPKLMILSSYPEFNIVLSYSSTVQPFVLESNVPFASGVFAKRFVLSENNCLALYPHEHYSVSVSLPSDCNGTIQGMVFHAYYGSTSLYSITLSGTKSVSFGFDVNGFKYSIPEGASLSFKVCRNSTCASRSESYHYGKSSDVSWLLSCDTFFPQQPQQETNSVSPPASGSAPSEANANNTTKKTTTPKTVTVRHSVSKSTKNVSPPTSSGAESEELNVNVPVTPTEHRPGVFGVPLDQAIVIAIVVIVALIVVIRFFV